MNDKTYIDKIEAISAAMKIAQQNGYCFAIQYFSPNEFWTVSTRKPMFRSGKVIECRDDGKTYLA